MGPDGFVPVVLEADDRRILERDWRQHNGGMRDGAARDGVTGQG